jgi:hypothetical protein
MLIEDNVIMPKSQPKYVQTASVQEQDNSHISIHANYDDTCLDRSPLSNHSAKIKVLNLLGGLQNPNDMNSIQIETYRKDTVVQNKMDGVQTKAFLDESLYHDPIPEFFEEP